MARYPIYETDGDPTSAAIDDGKHIESGGAGNVDSREDFVGGLLKINREIPEQEALEYALKILKKNNTPEFGGGDLFTLEDIPNDDPKTRVRIAKSMEENFFCEKLGITKGIQFYKLISRAYLEKMSVTNENRT